MSPQTQKQRTKVRKKRPPVSSWKRGWIILRLLFRICRIISRENRRVVHTGEVEDNELQLSMDVQIQIAVAFRQTAIKLGGPMIKLGQFLSTQSELFPSGLTFSNTLYYIFCII